MSEEQYNRTREYMHAMELRLADRISELAIKMESCVGPLVASSNEAIRQSDRADRKAEAAHGRIDSLQRLAIPILIGWLATAAGAGFAFWRLYVEVSMLQ